jgi:hypothetical protein
MSDSDTTLREEDVTSEPALGAPRAEVADVDGDDADTNSDGTDA